MSLCPMASSCGRRIDKADSQAKVQISITSLDHVQDLAGYSDPKTTPMSNRLQRCVTRNLVEPILPMPAEDLGRRMENE
jgi:hypothetical protein